MLPADMNDAFVTINEDGRRENVAISELVAGRQKKGASEARFREAHDLKQSVEADIAIATDLRAGFANRDQVAIRRSFRNAGLSDEQVDEIFGAGDSDYAAGSLSDNTGGGGTGASTGSGNTDSDVDGDERTILLETVAQLQKEVAELRQGRQQDTEARKKEAVLRAVDAALDSDVELSTILTELDGDDEKEFRKLAYAQVATATKTTPWGPRAIQEGLKALKARRRAWGGASTSTSEGTAEDGTSATGADFIGPAGSSVSQTHQPTGEKKVSVYDEGYSASLLPRLQTVISRLRRQRGEK
jgi:hypothetical protein